MVSLLLTVTRDCNLRCSYCPTAKDGWPSLSTDQALSALDLFASWGGGEVKIFGGEPLLVPEVVQAVIERAEATPKIHRLLLSTNGLGLTEAWLARVRRSKKLVLTVSIDGRPEDHRRFRRALPGVADTYERLLNLLPALLATPRVVVTQTIPPASAARAAENFNHLNQLGFTRFNLLPGYYLPWTAEQLVALRTSFEGIGAEIKARWARGEALYLRNLYTLAPTPFFNTGLVVDVDGSLYPSNLILTGKLDSLRETLRVGTLSDPPDPATLAARSAEVNGALERALPPEILRATRAADAELTRLCRRLYPAWKLWRAGRGAAPSAAGHSRLDVYGGTSHT